MSWILTSRAYNLSFDEASNVLSIEESNKPFLLELIYAALPGNISMSAAQFLKLKDNYHWNPEISDQRLFADNVEANLSDKSFTDYSHLLEKIEMASVFGNYDFTRIMSRVESRIR